MSVIGNDEMVLTRLEHLLHDKNIRVRLAAVHALTDSPLRTAKIGMECRSRRASRLLSDSPDGDSEIHDLFDILTEMNSRYRLHDAFRASALGSACFEGFCRLFFRCYCPLTVERRDHLPDTPFLLCSNHTSHADSAALMTASGRSFRSFALIGASDYFFRSGRLRWAVSPLMNVIPIDREPGSNSLSACLETCRQFVQQTGGSLIFYPEGTRSQDGEMRAFKSGAVLFAIELDMPIVPAYIEGTCQILPKGRYMPRTGPVTVRFGEPIKFVRPQPGEFPREQRRRAVEQLTQSIRMLSSRREEQVLDAGLPAKETASQFHE
ncbi:MAG TPA: lysophospholipid acyltransferase family protein [Verrucomicrobiae bacterium]|nr:lysophospholipid acyltransferase family protein [Verrucomicrobiae bacterium]